jgi:hypothetical protein
MLWFMSLMVIDVSLVQSFYGIVNPVRTTSSGFQKSLSSLSQSNGFRIKSLKERNVYDSKTRASATTTETAAPTTTATETCNWSTPVPYSQLTVGVPKETLGGERKMLIELYCICE